MVYCSYELLRKVVLIKYFKVLKNKKKIKKIIENYKVIFHRCLFHMDIKTYERKLFHYQENLMKIIFGF